MTIRTSVEQGSALVVTLVTIVLMGFTMASYLDLISNQNIATMRSQQWNSSVPVLEAGIEEALAHLHMNETNLESSDWVFSDGLYSKERELGHNKFIVTISMAGTPTIVSRAYVRVPLGTNYIEPPRAVRVTLTNSALFAKGMVAKGQIQLNGNNIRTDSFDSADPNHSTNGRYDPAKAKDNGDVATNSTLLDSLNVWNAEIFGRVATGPGGTVKIGKNGVVGSSEWHAAGNSGIEPGRSSDDMNVQFPEVDPPFSGGAFVPAPGTVGGTNYTFVLGNGNWQLSSLGLSGDNKMVVDGDAVLYVTGDVSISGEAFVYLSTNSTLKMYVGGSSTVLGGNGVANAEGNANNFYYYGLPANTSLSLSGNAVFTGVIYAPQAHFTLNGGGSDTYDFVGASITDSVQMNGHFNFHYDENLAQVGPQRGYTIDSWNEISYEVAEYEY